MSDCERPFTMTVQAPHCRESQRYFLLPVEVQVIAQRNKQRGTWSSASRLIVLARVLAVNGISVPVRTSQGAPVVLMSLF